MTDGPTRAIFEDHGGRRWRRVVGLVLLVAAIASVSLVYLVPIILEPTMSEATRLSHLSAYGAPALGDAVLPMIGEGQFERVVAVRHEGGSTALTDPSTGEDLRAPSAAEEELLGQAPFAVLRYGLLPARQLALTFDDGPDPTWTPKILDLLAANHVQATFCMIGENVVKYPELAQRIVREGHEVCNHTFTHIDTGSASASRTGWEVTLTDRVLRAATGVSTPLMRPPYAGDDAISASRDAQGLLTVAELGYSVALFDLDSDDWRFTQPSIPDANMLDGGGHAILLHDGGGDRRYTVGYVQQLIELAKNRNYSFTTLRWVDPGRGDQAYRTVTPDMADRAAYVGSQALYSWTPNVIVLLFVGGLLGAFGLAPLFILMAFLHERGLRARTSMRARGRHRRSTLERHLRHGYQPLVSVVIAAFNEEKVIGETLAAIEQLKYPRLEVIVVDDGSSDSTHEILHKLCETRQGLKVISTPNGGKAAALNRGFEVAQGKVAVTIDADTHLRPETIGMMVRHFNDGRVGAVAGLVRVGNDRGFLTAWQAVEYISSIAVERTAQSLTRSVMIAPGACSAWRTELVRAVGGFSSDTLAEDSDMVLRLNRLGHVTVQENNAVAFTEAPQTLRQLLRQRIRWTFGSVQVLWKHRSIVGIRNGAMGWFTYPNACLALLVPIVFLPLVYGSLLSLLIAGQYAKLLSFVAIFTLAQLLTTLAGLKISGASYWYLCVVPFYRLLNDPLRTYLLYRAAYSILRGRGVAWNKVQRHGTLRLPEVERPQVSSPVSFGGSSELSVAGASSVEAGS